MLTGVPTLAITRGPALALFLLLGPPSLPLPSPGPRRVSRVPLCPPPPSACLPRCVLRLLCPGTAHARSPTEALPARTPLCPCTATPCHPLPPAPSGSVGRVGGGTTGLVAEQHLGLGGCPVGDALGSTRWWGGWWWGWREGAVD